MEFIIIFYFIGLIFSIIVFSFVAAHKIIDTDSHEIIKPIVIISSLLFSWWTGVIIILYLFISIIVKYLIRQFSRVTAKEASKIALNNRCERYSKEAQEQEQKVYDSIKKTANNGKNQVCLEFKIVSSLYKKLLADGYKIEYPNDNTTNIFF